MSMSENPFASAVADYQDDKLLKIVNSPGDFSSKLVDACRIEATRRGIFSYTPVMVNLELLDDYLDHTQSLITQNGSFRDCERFLLNKGLNENQTLAIMDKAVRTAPFKRERIKLDFDREEWSSRFLLIMIFVIVIIIIYIIN